MERHNRCCLVYILSFDRFKPLIRSCGIFVYQEIASQTGFLQPKSRPISNNFLMYLRIGHHSCIVQVNGWSRSRSTWVCSGKPLSNQKILFMQWVWKSFSSMVILSNLKLNPSQDSISMPKIPNPENAGTWGGTRIDDLTQLGLLTGYHTRAWAPATL